MRSKYWNIRTYDDTYIRATSQTNGPCGGTSLRAPPQHAIGWVRVQHVMMCNVMNVHCAVLRRCCVNVVFDVRDGALNVGNVERLNMFKTILHT